MRERCNTKSSTSYKNYGGRDIKVCSEWDDYPAFRDWANENGYRDGLSIDRINNNGNYEPNNCRWATSKQQARNKRDTVYYEINGETKPIIEWAEILNKPYKRIIQRHNRGIDPFAF
jgi:heme-degrading monooxygenase HmoA